MEFNNYVPIAIPTYIINLKKRGDRKTHILKEFDGRDEFSLHIVEAFQHSFGALGLWATIRHILQDLISGKEQYIIIGEDDLKFTEHYRKENLLDVIFNASKRDADILLGGVNWFSTAVEITDNLFWTDIFSGTQFTLIFKKFFPTLINTKLANYGAADQYITTLTSNIFFVHPFVAIQKDFGYSDATSQNNKEGRQNELFSHVENRLSVLRLIKENYEASSKIAIDEAQQSYEDIVITTYIINLPVRTERLDHIVRQFTNKPEFQLQIVEACKNDIGALGLWLSIRKIIKLAIDNNEEVIIICEDDHQFTNNYSKEYLFKNIVEADKDGACILSGGTGKYENLMPITKNRYWVGNGLSTQFTVIYKNFFQQILDEPYENIITNLTLSDLTSNKMLLFPFISVKKDFGYSDVTILPNKSKRGTTNMFKQSEFNLKRIQNAYVKFKEIE
jgi:GR25 family glycosyltransferase involved in LPS biosynthesis